MLGPVSWQAVEGTGGRGPGSPGLLFSPNGKRSSLGLSEWGFNQTSPLSGSLAWVGEGLWGNWPGLGA